MTAGRRCGWRAAIHRKSLNGWRLATTVGCRICRIRDATDRAITPALYATVNLNDDTGVARAELDAYMRAYYRQPLETMRHIQAIRGGSVGECLDRLAGYVAAGARQLILRVGSLDARPEMLAERL